MNGRGFPTLLKKMKSVIAFGNPLLDKTIYIDDNSLLDKYNLKEDSQKEITQNEMQSISQEISGYEQSNSAGGCSQNSLRVLQWLLKKQCKAVIFGSVGNDNEAVLLKQLLEEDGVQTRYIQQHDLPTGKTIGLIKGAYRTLVAYIGAAEKLPLKDLLAVQDFHTLVQESNFVYIEGFFLTNRIETARYVLDYCVMHNKTIIFNISAEYVCHMYPEVIKYFTENSDIVFGNKREFEALAKIMNLENLEELKKTLVKNGKQGNIVVITDGNKPGTCIYDGGRTENFDIPVIEEKDIKDTTGAGDAFTGGFIAGLCKNKSVMECAKIGRYSAFHIIKQTGCTLPNFQPDIFD